MAAIPRPFTLLGSANAPGGILRGLNGQTITGNSSGAWAIAANGTNQSITLAPSGTGVVKAYNGSSVEQLRLGTSDTFYWTLGRDNVSSGDLVIRHQTTEWARIVDTTGGLLLGTSTDSANGRIQLATHTTSAGGIGFGTETSLYRSAAGVLQQETGGTTDVSYFLNRTGGTAATGGMYLPTGVNALRLRINGGDALTLDSSQVATFAQDIYTAATSRYRWTGRSTISSSADGVIALTNNAANDFSRLQFGGTTSSFPALKRVSSALHVFLADDSALAEIGTSSLRINGQGKLTTTADGVFRLTNDAATDVARLCFGGTSSSFPALKRSAAAIHVRLADDSAYADIRANAFIMGAGPNILSASGSPEGVYAAGVGSLFLRTDGGANTTLYVKESGTGNTGWVAK